MKRVLAISLVVNGMLLLGAAVQLFRAPAKSIHAAKTGAKDEAIATMRVTNVVPGETTFVTNRFEWRQIESTNYDQLVANLRGVGCPERTIRDVVVGDVWRRWDAGQHPRERHSLFWLSGPKLVAAQRQQDADEQKLKTELTDALRRLFSYEWSPKLQRNPMHEELVLARLVVGDVAEERVERVLGLTVSLCDAWDVMRDRVRLDDDYAAIRQARDETERKIHATLSPAEFEEFRARAGLLEFTKDHDELLELRLAPGRLRGVALAVTEVRPLGWCVLDLEESLTDVEKQSMTEKLKDTLRGQIGEENFAEMGRLEDGRYRSIRDFTLDHNLTTETAHKVDDIRKAAGEEVRSLRGDKSLDAAAREVRLREVSAGVALSVAQLLGANLYGDFLRQNNEWVTNHTQL